MSENSKIEWTDHTFNPWEGCQKVGPGCDHCYAETRNVRFAGGTAINWGPGAPRRRTSRANWRKPLAWNAAHEQFFAEHGRRQRVFCASLADVFDNAVDPAWRRDLFDLIELTPNLNWLLLTKRIGNVFEMVARARSHDWLLGRDNVWLGATIVSQAEADRDIPKLLAVPARVRFLSMEPLLEPVNLLATGDVLCRCGGCVSMARAFPKSPGMQRIDWVIVGGESGPGARPMSIQWARGLRDQCVDAGVPFLFKQWGEWAPAMSQPAGAPGRFAYGDYEYDRNCFHLTDSYPRQFDRFGARAVVEHLGKRVTGRQLDGKEWTQFPDQSEVVSNHQEMSGEQG